MRYLGFIRLVSFSLTDCCWRLADFLDLGLLGFYHAEAFFLSSFKALEEEEAEDGVSV